MGAGTPNQWYFMQNELIDPTYLGGFPGSSDSKEYACNAGDQGLIPGLGRTPGEENGNPLQYLCLENFMDRPCGRKRVGHD